jgi:hypothetical protein
MTTHSIIAIAELVASGLSPFRRLMKCFTSEATRKGPIHPAMHVLEIFDHQFWTARFSLLLQLEGVHLLHWFPDYATSLHRIG